MDDVATCRNCGMKLVGRDYCYGGSAYHPVTGAQCPTNHYGGFVCSEVCDRAVCFSVENSMPGAGVSRFLDSASERSVRANWNHEP